MENVHFSKTKLQGGFWGQYEDLVRRVTVPAIYARFAETGRFASLQCRKELESHVFWDSDVAKWIESVAYLVQTKREPELERLADEAIDLMVKNQLPNGYFNSCYIAQMPDKVFTNRDDHELYCAGHLIEAAIAYDRATGKDALLKMVVRYVDYIYQVFYVEKSAPYFTPGHEEIELALLKLADDTGVSKYRELAAYFIEERGKHPEEVRARVVNLEESKDAYYRWVNQSAHPVREMTEVYGHTVRAGYLCTAMADLARQTGDKELLEVSKRLFRDIAETKLSITGGVGTQMYGESYGPAYRLPTRTTYNETCAAISVTMFAGELQRQDVNSTYADVIERILFNGMICGMSLDGDAFFYENPLEIDLRDYDYSTLIFEPVTHFQMHERNIPHRRRLQRARVFNCSCCPPNISRMLASITRYMYSVDGDTVYCHQFASAETELTVNGQPATLKLATNYPCDGKLTYTYHGPDAKLAVRIPDWCTEYDGATEKGYAYFPVSDGSVVELELPMEIHFVEANSQVSELAGKYAVTRGPIVYCMEGVDNGDKLWSVLFEEKGEKKVVETEEYAVPVLELAAFKQAESNTLYRIKSDAYEHMTARLIPYYAYANRGISDMQIWTQVK